MSLLQCLYCASDADVKSAYVTAYIGVIATGILFYPHLSDTVPMSFNHRMFVGHGAMVGVDALVDTSDLAYSLRAKSLLDPYSTSAACKCCVGRSILLSVSPCRGTAYLARPCARLLGRDDTGLADK